MTQSHHLKDDYSRTNMEINLEIFLKSQNKFQANMTLQQDGD